MRQVIIIPGWLNMSPGKVASQAAHVAARSGKGAATRIILRAKTPEEFLKVLGKAYAKPWVDVCLFADSAPTTEGTEDIITAAALSGVALTETLKQITSGLELY